MMIIHHFFAALNGWLDEMDDPRNQSYILYTQSDLVWMGFLKNMCAVRTMRGMEDNFNKETCIETLRLLPGDRSLNEMPHADTLNYYLEKLSPQCLSDIRKRMWIILQDFRKMWISGSHKKDSRKRYALTYLFFAAVYYEIY